MPGKVKVKIISGRNLPVMDRSSDTTDAYVEIKLGTTTYKTDVCRKSLHPKWNSEWYRFELDDAELQDEPLQIRLMDHDTYSANDAIGKVYLNLNPLLLPASGLLRYEWNGEVSRNRDMNAVMSGWIPVYDTMHGIRGEVNLTVKVELFSDSNKFRQSSCGVLFFYSKTVPHGYYAQTIHGFVEELIVSDDPEYQWIDKIRTPRASNEARQTLFFKLSGELQRKIGLKALEMGGNAVIAYTQCFDLEGESGIVARGIGTAVTLVKLMEPLLVPTEPNSLSEENSEAVRSLDQGEQRVDPVYLKFSRSPGILRRSSDSDLSVTPKGNSLTGSERSGHVPSSYCFRNNILLRSLPHKDNFDLLEYPFLSLSKCPPGFISYLGGTVCARSVKLLERITNPEEPETRDMWWSELRLEIRSHARTLNCNAVLGYCETTSICEDVCILSATGTAVIIRPNDDNFRKSQIIERNETEKDALDPPNPQESPEKDRSSSSPLPCTICHLPYNANAVPLRLTSSKCSSCRREKVPDILLATIELPDGVPLTGHGCLLQAHVCRMLRETRGESNAKEISDGLPFLEYELHRILVSKLKMRGMNAIFGLKVRITVGERMLVGLGTGTGVFLSALPPPSIPKLVSDHSDGKKVAEMQREIENVVRKNKEVYQITGVDLQNGSGDVDPRDVEVENSVFDYSSGNKDCCILEVDDPEDAEFLNLLMEHRPPDGFHAVTTQFLPGLEDADVVKNLQMFTQIWRSKVQPPIAVGKLFERLLQSVFFKLRRMVPCALCDLQFRLDLPEPDEIQLCVLGMALGLTELKKTVKKNDEELIFNYEEDQSPEASVIPMQRINKKRGSSYRDRHGVDITPLSFVPGAKIESYLGNLNFFLIRETQSIREEGGLSGFLHSFVTEALAIVRAHVTALGGNAMVAYFMTECVLNHNLHKNQGQCLINVGGDVVYVSYKEEKQ